MLSQKCAFSHCARFSDTLYGQESVDTGSLDATPYDDILDNSVLQQFGEGRFLLQHVNAPVHKPKFIYMWFTKSGVEELGWPEQNPENLTKHLQD